MNNNELKKHLAKAGYNIGFGAKKHFATFDIAKKIPSKIAFLTLSIGIVQLGYPELSYNKEVSIIIIVMGLINLFVYIYGVKIAEYETAGIKITQLYNDVSTLYSSVGADDPNEVILEKLNRIQNEFYQVSISDQMPFSHELAHFKFFYELQVNWIVEELRLTFWKDKVPNSFKINSIALLILILITILFIFTNEQSSNIQ